MLWYLEQFLRKPPMKHHTEVTTKTSVGDKPIKGQQETETETEKETEKNRF